MWLITFSQWNIKYPFSTYSWNIILKLSKSQSWGKMEKCLAKIFLPRSGFKPGFSTYYPSSLSLDQLDSNSESKPKLIHLNLINSSRCILLFIGPIASIKFWSHTMFFSVTTKIYLQFLNWQSDGGYIFCCLHL